MSQRKAFVIKILNNQHATWQGTLTWLVNNETIEFRSALELIRLLNNAIEMRNDMNLTKLSDATEM